MSDPSGLNQSESIEPSDGQMVAIATDHGVRWMICSRGVCLYDESGKRLMVRYQALQEMQRRASCTLGE